MWHWPPMLMLRVKALPVAVWRNILPAETKLAIGTTADRHSSRPWKGQNYTDAQLYGLANYILSDGADDVYMFNHTYLTPFMDPAGLEPTFHAGALETLKDQPRRTIISYQDECAVGEQKWMPLPLSLGNQIQSLAIYTGAPNEKMYLLIDTEGDVAPNLWFNGETPRFLGHTQVEDTYADHPVRVYEVTELRPCRQILEANSPEPRTSLKYVELTTELPPLTQ